jgi:hypothetical protein
MDANQIIKDSSPRESIPTMKQEESNNNSDMKKILNRNLAANNENKPFRILKNKFFNASSKMERERSPNGEVENYTKSGLAGKGS